MIVNDWFDNSICIISKISKWRQKYEGTLSDEENGIYPGYQRFFLAELRFVGRRPKTRAAKPREKTSSTQGKWHLNKQEKIWYRRWSKRRPGRLFNLKGSTEISLVENSSRFLFSWKFVINDNIIPSVKRDIVVASQDIRDFKIQRRDGNENVA